MALFGDSTLSVSVYRAGGAVHVQGMALECVVLRCPATATTERPVSKPGEVPLTVPVCDEHAAAMLVAPWSYDILENSLVLGADQPSPLTGFNVIESAVTTLPTIRLRFESADGRGRDIDVLGTDQTIELFIRLGRMLDLHRQGDSSND